MRSALIPALSIAYGIFTTVFGQCGMFPFALILGTSIKYASFLVVASMPTRTLIFHFRKALPGDSFGSFDE
jgi:hypothetical protein